MFNFFHRLLHPHCVECTRDTECKSCETLQQQLAQVNREKHDLINTIIKLSQPKVALEEPAYQPDLADLKPKVKPWGVLRAELEANDRNQAKLLKDKQKEIEDTKAAAAYTVKVDPIVDKLEQEVLGDLEDAK